jgi:predicted DNA-binding protein YlxM (UPF0122 family)
MIDINDYKKPEYILDQESLALALAELHNIKKILLNNSDNEIVLNGFIITDIISTMFQALRNVFSNILKNKMFSFNVNKSEFKIFYSSNTKKIQRVLSLPWESISDIEVDFPRGMKTDYLTVINNINSTYNILNMKDTSNNIVRILTDIFTDLVKLNKLSNIVDNNQIKALDDKINRCDKLVSKNFEDKRTFTKPLKKLFKDNNDLKLVTNDLLTMEQNILNVTTIFDNMKKCENKCDDIINKLEVMEDKDIDKTILANLSDYVKNIAGLFESYSVNVTTHTVIEHNMIYVIKELGVKNKIF